MYGISSHKVIKRGNKLIVVKNNCSNSNSSEIFKTPSNFPFGDRHDVDDSNFRVEKRPKLANFDDFLGENSVEKKSNRISLLGIFSPKGICREDLRTKNYSLKDLPNPNSVNFAKRRKDEGIFKKNRRDPFAEHCRELRRLSEKCYPKWASTGKTNEKENFDTFSSAFADATGKKSSNFIVNPKYSNVIRRDPLTNQLRVEPTFENLINDVSFDLGKRDTFQFRNEISPPLTRPFKFDLSTFQTGFVNQKPPKVIEKSFFDENLFTNSIIPPNEEWTFSKAPMSQKIVWKQPPAPNLWFKE